MKTTGKKMRIQHLVEFCECDCHTRGTDWNKKHPCKKCVVTQQTNKKDKGSAVVNYEVTAAYDFSSQTNTKQPDWEKEFDKRWFNIQWNAFKNIADATAVKSFLSQNFISKEELGRKVEGMKKVENDCESLPCRHLAYNEALSDLLEFIKK